MGSWLTLGASAARAATITINSLADPGASGICALRDAITASNTQAAVNGCAAGTGSDTLDFSVSGTIILGSTLPTIENVSPASLTIDGSGQTITVSGNNAVQVMTVNSGATLNLQNLTIANGLDTSGASGILNQGKLTVTNSTFSGNTGFGTGGGIDNDGALIVTNSTFSGNIAVDGGGISNDFGATLTVTNSTFSGNTGFDDGGGILNNGGTLTVTNTTFSGNSGFDGGGGIFSGGTLTVTNSTFTDNSGDDVGGGGIYNAGGSIDVKGTILAASTDGNCFDGVNDEGYNLSDDDSCDFSQSTSANNVTDAELDLDPTGLQNNGGPTQTVALKSNSVAINQIPVADCTDQESPPVRLYTDQRGVIRPQFTACDIGAYEYDTARSLKTNVFNAINSATGVNGQNKQKLKLGAGSLFKAALLLSGDGGNSVSPALGGLEFQTEETAVQLLAGLTPSSALSGATLDTWLFNITLADRTLAVVAITGAGGDTYASQLVADGDAAVAAGAYLTAIKDYAKAWGLVAKT
jgi:predicted outer membrane repeat protein